MMFDDDDAPEEATFALLYLPNHLIKKVINQMTIFRMFGFSLISKQTLQIVSESNRTTWAPAIVIGNAIEVRIDHHTKFIFQPTHREIDQCPLKSIKLTGHINTWTGSDYYFKPGYTMKDWVNHIFKIFNNFYKNALLYWLDDTEMYSVASVKRVFPDCERLIINISNPQFEVVTDAFLTKLIKVLRNDFEEPHFTKRLQKIQIQNFSRVLFSNRASFDTFLISNAKCFDVSSSNLTYKEANRFLKLWARGAMPNMKHFSGAIRRGSVEEITERVLKGIQHNWVIMEVQCGECQKLRNDGFAIYRVGGARAQVKICSEYSDEESFLFDIFVEH